MLFSSHTSRRYRMKSAGLRELPMISTPKPLKKSLKLHKSTLPPCQPHNTDIKPIAKHNKQINFSPATIQPQEKTHVPISHLPQPNRSLPQTLQQKSIPHQRITPTQAQKPTSIISSSSNSLPQPQKSILSNSHLINTPQKAKTNTIHCNDSPTTSLKLTFNSQPSQKQPVKLLQKSHHSCIVCNKQYSYRSGLFKHIQRDHPAHTSSQTGNIKCLERMCSFTCRYVDELRRHLVLFHAVPMEKETLTFETTEGMFSITSG